MAVLKEKMLISQFVYNIAAKFQGQNSCFQGQGIQWNYIINIPFYYYVMQAEVRNPKGRVTDQKYLYLRLYTSLLKNSKSNSHVSKVDEFKKAFSHTV